MLLTRLPSIQSFVNFAADFGFFLHVPRFLTQLRTSIPPTDQSPLPAALVQGQRDYFGAHTFRMKPEAATSGKPADTVSRCI